MYVIAETKSMVLECTLPHILDTTNTLWVHLAVQPVYIYSVCYQLADSEAFQVLAVKESKDTMWFWGQSFMSSVRGTENIRSHTYTSKWSHAIYVYS